MKNKLPDLPSDLLLISLEDIEKVENDPNSIINMKTWATKDYRGICHVCHAGAVMMSRISFNIEKGITLSPCYYDSDTQKKLYALDEFRTGSIDWFLRNFGIKIPSSQCPDVEDLVLYSGAPQDSEEWQIYKDWIVDVAMWLKSEGY